MSQQVRMLLAVGLSLGIFYGWYRWVAPPPDPQMGAEQPAPVRRSGGEGGTNTAGALPSAPSPTATAAPTEATKPPPAAGPTIPDPQAGLPEERTVITTDRLVVELTNAGGVPTAWRLRNYIVGNGGEHAVDMVTRQDLPPVALGGDLLQAVLPPSPRYHVDQPDPLQVVYRWRSSQVEITKKYRFREGSYLVDVEIAVRNVGAMPLDGHVALQWGTTIAAPTQTGLLAFLHGPPNVWSGLYYQGGKVTRQGLTSAPVATRSGDGALWGGVENRYYLAAILPHGTASHATAALEGTPGVGGAGSLHASVAGGPVILATGQASTESFALYVGPKQLEELKAAGATLEKALDYGWFGFAAIPILYLLKFFYQLVHNYGVAIILLTLFIKGLLHPVTKASMRSMKKMQQLQPRLKELREKYKNDRERLNLETMQLFRGQGVNPMGGCLPMVLQIPVYIALYKVLWNAVELYRAPFIWFYRDLSAPDPYFISPILLGITFFLQQKLMPSPTMDPAQQKMMMFMPVMFTGFMIFLPSGLVIYILVNTLFSVLQQWLMNRGLGFRDLFRGRLAPRPL